MLLLFLLLASSLLRDTVVEARQLRVAQYNAGHVFRAAGNVHIEENVSKRRRRDCVPREVHVAIAENLHFMRIVWSTTSDRCDADVSYSQLLSTNSSGLSDDDVARVRASGTWLSSQGDSYTLTERQMCSGRARNSKFTKTLHTVMLTQLELDTEYQYSIAGDSRVRRFRTGPRRGSSRLSFVAYGDMGWEGKQPMAAVTVDAVSREHEEQPLDLLLHVGDLSYANGKPKAWDSFMGLIEDLASEVPYMVAIGNHEYGYDGTSRNDPSGAARPYQPDWGNFGADSDGECGAMAASHFLMPVRYSLLSRPKFISELMQIGTTEDIMEEQVLVHQEVAEEEEAGRNRGVESRKLLAAAASLEEAGLQLSAAAAFPAGRSSLLPAADLSSESLLQSLDDNPPFWYSFDYGLMHFTVLSTEHDLSPGSTQQAWLEADLASVDRCATPWLLVAMHRPMYVVYPHKSNRDVGEKLREFLEDLLLEYKVDLVVSGHVHSYYRSCSVRRGRCSEHGSGITHLVLGTGGHKLSEVEDQQQDWCSAASRDHGFGLFNIHNDKLTFKFIRSEDRQVSDMVTIHAQVPQERCTDLMFRQVVTPATSEPEKSDT